MVKRRRTSGSTFRRTNRRRFTRFRRRFRGKKNVSYTTQSGIGPTLGFRNRKTNRKRYKRVLWDSTMFKAHYRSIGSNFTITATPNNVTQSTQNRIKALDNAVDVFWAANGGAQSVDAATPVPIFGSTITIRGGIARITLTTTSTDDPLRVRVFAVWTNKRPSIPAGGTAVALDWDPSCFPSFDRIVGKVLFSKEALLLPGGNSLTCSYRLKAQRIDKETFNNDGNQLFWYYSVCQLSNVEAIAAAETVFAVTSFNLSFVGDEDNT